MPFNPLYRAGENWSLTGSKQLFPLIRYCPISVHDPFELYGRLTNFSPHSFFLEHDDFQGGQSHRYAYVGSEPYGVIKGTGANLALRSGGAWTRVSRQPFEYLRDVFRRQPPQATQKILPFQGGVIGCLGYDLARFFEPLPCFANDDLQFPELYGLLVDTFVVVDQDCPGVWLVFAPPPERVAGESWAHLLREGEARLSDLKAKLYDAGKGFGNSRHIFRPRIYAEQSAEEYQHRVRECQSFIASGDIYQANLSHRFRIENLSDRFSSTALAGGALFREVRRSNPSPHSAFLVLDSDVVVCNSPERLVRLTNGHVEMRPIAGTRPRGGSTVLDRKLAEELLSHPKERAEHLMLVDLTRNDLGRVCEYGTVRMDELMTIERYSHVMHLVSQVSGEVRKGVDSWDVLQAVFPGGTITGVPKIHCMELIERLEPVRRGLYTGSIGFMGWNGNMDWNIVIRTLLLHGECGYLQVGAGIVADSDPQREFEETIHKAEAFFGVLHHQFKSKEGYGCGSI